MPICVCVNNDILFFGGCCYNHHKNIISSGVFKYSIRENEWTICYNTLPSPLGSCFAVLNEDNTYVHIIGGCNEEMDPVSTHMRIQVNEWLTKGILKNATDLYFEEEEKQKNETEMYNISNIFSFVFFFLIVLYSSTKKVH
ncbi:hypothetical protein RFI_29724 [Reticulomyxa filosa]|uniref:Uncharacterized protein n=1 Tax=Reticulomyxa filosa TaxID=46433 RepID=X6M244_RETFI|nr:hypothetical protein RFI_29724 [Reticulomyxa filosa]|eukprot:ETO07666.1 hypothetical protein RFI_29724 [Reticulomyxa filosa]